MVSPTQRQSGELFKKAAALYGALGRPVDAEAESAMQLSLANGSRIVALPGREGTIRSYSGVDLLLIDEAPRVLEDTYVSVRPMLAVSGGRLIALSTPFGNRGWWYEAWRDGADWERVKVPADQCPRISPDWLEEERRDRPRWYFEQEYLCEFLDAKGAVFSQADIDRAFSEHYETWDIFGERSAAEEPREEPATAGPVIFDGREQPDSWDAYERMRWSPWRR